MSADSATPARPARWRPWVAPAGFAVVLVAALVAVIVLSQRAGDSGAPPQPGPFRLPAGPEATVAFDVASVTGGRLVLAGGGGRREVTIAQDARVDVLRVVTLRDVRPGEAVVIVGIPNEVRNFSIRSIVAIGAGGGTAGTSGALARGPAGFAGHEVSRDARERPVLDGVVDRSDAGSITLRAASGPVTIVVASDAPLRRMAPGTIADIRDGDRVAFAIDAEGNPRADRLLVLPGGGR